MAGRGIAILEICFNLPGQRINHYCKISNLLHRANLEILMLSPPSSSVARVGGAMVASSRRVPVERRASKPRRVAVRRLLPRSTFNTGHGRIHRSSAAEGDLKKATRIVITSKERAVWCDCVTCSLTLRRTRGEPKTWTGKRQATGRCPSRALTAPHFHWLMHSLCTILIQPLCLQASCRETLSSDSRWALSSYLLRFPLKTNS